MSDLIQIAIDAGASGERLMGTKGSVKVSAHVATNGGGINLKIEGLARRKPPLKIESENTPPLYVGDTAALFGRPVENLNHDRQSGTPEMRAVFYAAITEYQRAYGKFKTALSVAVALPNQFINDEDAKGQVKRWMVGGHNWKADGEAFTCDVAEVKPTSQAASAMFDYLLDEKGQWQPQRKEHFKKEIGIVSVGFDTVELMAINGKAPVPRFTGGEKVGARRLLRLYDPRELYALGELEPMLRNGSLDVHEQLPVWEREVTGFIENKWGTAWRRFAAVVIVGGGAVLLRDTLPYKFNGKAFVADDPTMAVARGLYKLMLNQAARKG